eukprot:scaffold13462_cov105-Skeletonema_dohrnii-CCMP3373.AAC.6
MSDVATDVCSYRWLPDQFHSSPTVVRKKQATTPLQRHHNNHHPHIITANNSSGLKYHQKGQKKPDPIYDMHKRQIKYPLIRATVIFLYLVPRGLRLIKPIVWPKEDAPCTNDDDQTTSQTDSIIRQKSNKCRRVITYMSPFEDEEYVRKELCHVDHQVGAAWPVYLYHTKSF